MSLVNLQYMLQYYFDTILHKTQISEKANYCQMFDQFFDCLNVRSLEENQKKTNPFLKPYTNDDDKRFSWIIDQFLPYLNTWKENTQNGLGEFNQNPRSKMFVCLQTNHSIQITVRSTVKAVKYLLEKGSKFILMERFCQDPVEE